LSTSIPAPEGEVFLGHEAPITSLLFSPNGRLFMSADQQDEVRLWDVATGKVLRRRRDMGEVLGLAFSHSRSPLLLWDEENKDLLAIMDYCPRLPIRLAIPHLGCTLRIASSSNRP
jgi:WD40 repeat protein